MATRATPAKRRTATAALDGRSYATPEQRKNGRRFGRRWGPIFKGPLKIAYNLSILGMIMMNGDSLSLEISRNPVPRNIECAHSMVPRCVSHDDDFLGVFEIMGWD